MVNGSDLFQLSRNGMKHDVAAFLLCSLGLTFIGIWTNTLGYAFGFLPETVDETSNLFLRISFFCGIAVSGITCMAFAPWLQQRIS